MRWTVPDPTPNAAAIFRMPLSPFARAFLMLASVLTAILGRPRGLAVGAGTLKARIDVLPRSLLSEVPIKLGQQKASYLSFGTLECGRSMPELGVVEFFGRAVIRAGDLGQPD